MARTKSASTGTLSVNLTRLTMRPVDSLEFVGAYIVAVDGNVTIRLLASQTICGSDANGAWYANATERVETLAEVDRVEIDGAGNIAAYSGDNMLWVPAILSGRATIEGEPEMIAPEVEEPEAEEPEVEEPEVEEPEVEAPRPTRIRRTRAQIEADEAAEKAAEAAARRPVAPVGGRRAR